MSKVVKVLVKSTFTSYAVIEVDADNFEDAENELGKLEKSSPTKFLNVDNIELNDFSIQEITKE